MYNNYLNFLLNACLSMNKVMHGGVEKSTIVQSLTTILVVGLNLCRDRIAIRPNIKYLKN